MLKSFQKVVVNKKTLIAKGFIIVFNTRLR